MPENRMESLTFNLNGTLPPEVVESLPTDLRQRVTDPDFIRMAKKSIQAQRGIVKTGRREFRPSPIRIGVPPGGGLNRKARRAMKARLRPL
jgi:hypothetical protein